MGDALTPIDPTTLKPGDKVSHAEAPELLFKVVDVSSDGDGVVTVEVRSALTGDVSAFEVDPRLPTAALGMIVAPPVKPLRAVGEVDAALDENHRRLARSTFKGFRLVGGHRQVEAYTRRWFFRRPDHGNCCFHLVTWPGYLLVTGDVGDCLWSRTENMLKWAADNVHDRQYLMSKTPAQMREKQWSHEKAEAEVDKWYAGRVESRLFEPVSVLKSDLRADLAELRDDRRRLRGCASDEFEFYTATMSLKGWQHDDYPDCRRPPNNYEWCHSALRVGLELLGYLPKDLCLGGKKEGATPEGEIGDSAKVEAESAAAVGA